MTAVPHISTVVPCYKQGGFLPVALDSIRAQTFADWECIIVNDGSPDDTAAVAREWTGRDPRFRYVEKANGGLSSARNAGLAVARGEFVHFLDADDFMLPGFYKAVIDRLALQPEATAAFSGWTMVDEEGAPMSTDEVREETTDWFHLMLKRCLCPCHALVIRRTAFGRCGNFQEALRSCEDWDMWLRIAASGAEFVKVEGYYACYRQHGQSMTMNHRRMLQSGFQVIRTHARVHGRCRECRKSAREGRKNFARYVWTLTQGRRGSELLAEGRLVAYAINFVRHSWSNPRWPIWNIQTLLNSKRLVASAVLRPFGIEIRKVGRPCSGTNNS